ncbi:MAG: sensor histidine kinase [Balneolaceae bacterium]|nr:sensor histidine kinase [Balneolaceae bacterium]
MKKIREGDYSVKKYVAVVSAFIVAASLLVVLTTFAINMLTATGDLNRLMVQWAQNNSNNDSLIVDYLETGDQSSLLAYESSKSAQKEVENVIDELMTDQPKANIVFSVFSSDEIHPNEINGLIRIFTLFSETDQIQMIKQTWFDLQEIQQKKEVLFESLISESNPPVNVPDSTMNRLEELKQGTYTLSREMILGSSSVLLMLKRYSLWVTILLGILIVLIGVIYTVRGIKQIKRADNLLQERDYLALFPELNQYPVFNISASGDLGFINQSALQLFPSLQKKGLNHPFLEKLKSEMFNLSEKWGSTSIKEINTGGKYYQQVINFISKEKGIHVHSIDITQLKEEQLKLSESLEEKNILLAEIHHRVKNNMAVISGLLELQEMLGDSPETALAESRSRIQSMAIVHELLYQSDSFSAIDAAQYINKLGNHLQVNFSRVREVHSDVFMGDDATININLAVPLGLLINEIAYYIFTIISETEDKISIHLSMKQMEDQYCVQIQASGKQVKNNLNGDTSNLRLNLIQKLLKQIDGQLKYPESDHFTIQIVFDSTIKKGSNSAYL